MIKGVLFDMDGLMFDTERIWSESWLETGRQWGIPITEAIVCSMRGRNHDGCDEICRQNFGPQFDAPAFRAAATQRMRAQVDRDGVPVKPGLKALLQELRRRDIPAILATSTTRNTALSYLERAGVGEYFKGAVCGDEVQNSKPHPEVFLKAAALTGAAPQCCMVLEDSPNGIRAGAAAGCVPVMVPDLTLPDGEMQSLAAHIIPSLADAIPLLDEL